MSHPKERTGLHHSSIITAELCRLVWGLHRQRSCCEGFICKLRGRLHSTGTVAYPKGDMCIDLEGAVPLYYVHSTSLSTIYIAWAIEQEGRPEETESVAEEINHRISNE